jgi:hypothetical protein
MSMMLNLNPEVEEGLLALAKARGVSLSDYLRMGGRRMGGRPACSLVAHRSIPSGEKTSFRRPAPLLRLQRSSFVFQQKSLQQLVRPAKRRTLKGADRLGKVHQTRSAARSSTPRVPVTRKPCLSCDIDALSIIDQQKISVHCARQRNGGRFPAMTAGRVGDYRSGDDFKPARGALRSMPVRARF